MERKVENIIEKIIKLRIDNIIEKSILNTEIADKIKGINESIKNETKIKNRKKSKNEKKRISKDDKKMNPYTLFIKDVTNIIKGKHNLNYLPNNIISEINIYKDKTRSEQFKGFSIIWNGLNNEIKNKYRELCQNKDFTNFKYNKIIEKISTQELPKKKKIKESLK